MLAWYFKHSRIRLGHSLGFSHKGPGNLKIIRNNIPAKEWRFRPAPPAGFSSAIGFSEIQARLLYNRGLIDLDHALAFLAGDERLSHDPFLLPDMASAVACLREAIDLHEGIAVFGDFDADGLTGTAIIVMALSELGARVVPYLPNRVSEGHGLNPIALGSIRGQGVSTMVTVDCGTNSFDEISFGNALGLETIVTDHHSISGTLPEAVAIVNPKRSGSGYPYLELTGAGLAYKLVEALCLDMGRPRPEHLLEIAAIGTVADVGKLTGENRYIVKKGLEYLNSTEHHGLKALIKRIGLSNDTIDSGNLSFNLVPRLNASGRIGDANISLELLTSKTRKEAEDLAEQLELANQARRKMSELAFTQAMDQVELENSAKEPVIFVGHKEWHPGILGLVAGRLSEYYQRPVIALAMGTEISRASVRSIPEVDVIEALDMSKNRLVRYGGHSAAAGFTIYTQELPVLKSDLVGFIGTRLDIRDIKPAVDIDLEVPPKDLDGRNFEFIKSLGPFGEGNPDPVFLTRHMHISESRRVGRDGAHLIMWLVHDAKMWEAIAFKQGHSFAPSGGVVDVIYNIGLNEWGGIPKLELKVIDFQTVSS